MRQSRFRCQDPHNIFGILQKNRSEQVVSHVHVPDLKMTPPRNFVLERGDSHGKIFLEQAFADFSNRKFGLEFADPRSFSKIGQILPANSSNFFGLAISGNSKPNFLLVKSPRRNS